MASHVQADLAEAIEGCAVDADAKDIGSVGERDADEQRGEKAGQQHALVEQQAVDQAAHLDTDGQQQDAGQGVRHAQHCALAGRVDRSGPLRR